MAKNVYSLQLLRNTNVFADKQTAIQGITSASTQDGVIKLARYTEGDETKTIFGIYHDFGSGNAGYTIYDSYQEVIADIQERIADLESGSTEIMDILGTGVTSANTVTDQLEALSGDTASTSADTSVEGAKRYADEKVADAVADLDGTITADTGYYINKVDEVDGKISGTTAALPTVAAISSEGQAITAVSQSLGTVDASYGDIAAAHVTVADANSAFTATTVEDVLAEIDAAYKAADDAIVGDATTSGDTLGKLEDRIEALATDAKEYHIVKTTEDLPATIKESYSLVDADGHVSGDTIDIPKDSHIVSVNYITDTGDTHYQNLEYVYITDSGTTSTTYVDMSQLVLESEFASGVTSTNGVVHGVVDPTSEKDSNNVYFLTVGADGFKVDGIKNEIDAKIAALDASVTGGTTAGTATADHIQVVVDEVDGKLTAVTVTETNIADADDLAALSAKTVTEIASSNSSISATGSTTADGTVEYDLVTDASKIKLDGYTSGSSSDAVVATDTVNQAIGKLENQIKAAVAGGLQQVEAGSGITVSAVADNKQTIDVKLAAVGDLPTGFAENAIKFDATNHGLYIDTLDCGTY